MFCVINDDIILAHQPGKDCRYLLTEIQTGESWGLIVPDNNSLVALKNASFSPLPVADTRTLRLKNFFNLFIRIHTEQAEKTFIKYKPMIIEVISRRFPDMFLKNNDVERLDTATDSAIYLLSFSFGSDE